VKSLPENATNVHEATGLDDKTTFPMILS